MPPYPDRQEEVVGVHRKDLHRQEQREAHRKDLHQREAPHKDFRMLEERPVLAQHQNRFLQASVPVEHHKD